MKNRYHYINCLVLLAVMLLAACSSDSNEETSTEASPEIYVTSDVYRRPEGTRTATYDDVTALQTEAHFTCMAYMAGTLTSYISTTTVDWIPELIDDNKWRFNNGSGASHYYWPLPATNGGAWPSLDFFGYMPATFPGYIRSVTYTAAHNVTFTCTDLPMNNAGQDNDLKEFMFGMALDKNYGNAAAGVSLTFQHPFARIKLQLAASHPDITINSITLSSVKNNGNFTYNHSASTLTWALDGVATDFTLTLTDDAAEFNNNPATATQIGDDYIMIPQSWAGEIVVNADCLYWGEKVNYPSLTTTVPTTWLPGYSYTYTLTISPNDLIVDTQKFTEQW